MAELVALSMWGICTSGMLYSLYVAPCNEALSEQVGEVI